MKKGFLAISVAGSILLATAIIGSSAIQSGEIFKTNANRGSNNSLSLSTQKISESSSSYSGEQSSTVRTANNNPITFKCSNVINNNSGWQTMLPGGYFYNPLTNSGTHNKITGIESVRFNSSGSSNLSLCYGYTLDDTNIIYSYEKTLEANTTYDLEDLNPSYIYIKNNNNTNVDITDFTVNYSCEETTYPKQNLNVLMIGNSYADDTVFYSNRVAASYGITINHYNAYIGSCTLDTHYANLTSNSGNTAYSMRSINNGSWVYQNNMTLTDIINSHTWDIITFQQSSFASGRSDTYSNLTNLANEVRSLVGLGPKFYWYQTWAYDTEYSQTEEPWDAFGYFNNDQISMYNAINSCYVNQVKSTGKFLDIIPGGTAVQNLRTSYMKDTFTRDGKHMSNVHGRYLLGLNFISSLYDIDFDKSPCSFMPVEADVSFKNVAFESVKNAVKSPLNFTNSLYTTKEISGYNLANYTEIDAEMVGSSYWNSTSSTDYNKRISTDSDNSYKYVTTKRFTSSTLPSGSLVSIGDSFGVRPEAWTSDAVQGSRPAENNSNLLVIDSSFFSGYQYRAFNIYKIGKPTLYGQFNQIFDNFHIFVPNSLMGGLTPKSNNANYNSDKTLFTNNGLNIDYYERVHLDPIAGYYNCSDNASLKNVCHDSTGKKFVCSRPFYTASDDLPGDSVIIIDSGYQWRSDAWTVQGKNTSRPGNVTAQFTRTNGSFMNDFRRRTFNVSSTSSALVEQDYINFMNHLRVYKPIQSIPGVSVDGISLSDSVLSVTPGNSKQLTAEISPSYASNKNVTWTSSNNSIATVDSTGLVTGVGLGTTTITARTEDGGFTASSTVYVEYYPEGTYRVNANVSGIKCDIVISIGTRTNSLLAVRLANTDAVPTSFTYNPSTGAISIETSGSYSGMSFGKITGTYQHANNRIINVGCNGTVGNYVTNNNSLTMNKATNSSNSYYNECEGTTSELQTVFKRRYMSGSWQVDNTNADRISANTTEFVSGNSSVKRRGYSGGAVALNLYSDLSSKVTVKNIHYWVYNPSGNDITLRMWGYKSTGLNNNFETGTVTAKAGQWTYVAMGFTSAAIYNFQIADFNNTGVYLSFDNIYLF